MKTWLINRWDAFRSSFWFVPTLLATAAVLCAWIMPAVDHVVTTEFDNDFGWTVKTAESARMSMSSIAGAMITVTGVVFSITIVALATTASQFGSRLLRSFMEDFVTHLALGSLLSTSLYCLLILRVIQDSQSEVFVPHLSVALGILGAILSMGVFIYFIHHVAMRLQAPNLVQSVAADLLHAVDHLFPEEIGTGDDESVQDLDLAGNQFSEPRFIVYADSQGYLQAVDNDGLMEFAATENVVIQLLIRPGAFLSEGVPLAKVYFEGNRDQNKVDRVNRYFITGRLRSPRQDIEYAVDQVVEIAVRALSPGINDPYTAMTCVDYLGAALARLASRQIPSPLRSDVDGNVRLLTEAVSFGAIARNAIRPILHFGREVPMIHQRLLGVYKIIANSLRRTEDQIALDCEVEHLQAVAEEFLHDARARQAMVEECPTLRRRISVRESGSVRNGL